MSSSHLCGDRGSTLPIYIWLTAILLFAAFAFFAFAQAASARNGAQSAADAAALAAAQSARDELMLGLGDALEGGDNWLDWLDGMDPKDDGAPGAAAGRLAAANDAEVVNGPAFTKVNGHPGYEVGVETLHTVGDTIIPGTENQRAKAHATAVVQPRCDVPLDADPKKPLQLTCDGKTVDFDPEDFDLDELPDASDLFAVRLAD
ncbi:pilus assembly protein TadG-related protein [Streptomyces sp. NBC_01016]|uniref:pilus assembly protein TadG-related protein n=1 Tax=Streptomyces sp. NBC_01016 TaxID=2903720 RepID=UPI002255B54D|nr:pilus assembly protein TadG-related protein [Streptomyces sp. NBC_01016]MCX4829047.1 pilus assembly protein TadG-related protein [Streptomyces sp. NBC_01016]